MTRPSTPPSDGGDHLDSQLLERYWLGASPPEEVAHVETWFETHPTRRAEYERLRTGAKTDGWRQLSPPELSARTAAIERAIRDTDVRDGVERSTASPTPDWKKRSARESLPRRIWYGVSIIAACGLMFIAGHWTPPGLFTRQSTVATTTYTTRPGERANITLPDGSTVALNVASRLEVPVNFWASHRTLRLNGEALFTVARQTGSPFTVIAGQTTTHVLGTSFIVRRYTTDTTTTVAVHDGKVSVQSIVVTAQQQAAVDPHGEIHLEPASPAQFTFAKGVLTLDGVALKDAIADLDRWYDADIRVKDPTLLTHRIHGTYTTGSLTDLSSILELTLNVRVARDGRALTLFPK